MPEKFTSRISLLPSVHFSFDKNITDLTSQTILTSPDNENPTQTICTNPIESLTPAKVIFLLPCGQTILIGYFCAKAIRDVILCREHSSATLATF